MLVASRKRGKTCPTEFIFTSENKRSTHMLVEFRTLTNKQYEIEIDPSLSIKDVREFIATKYNYHVDQLSLFYHSKRLENGQTVESVGIEAGSYVILLISNMPTQQPPPPPSNPLPKPIIYEEIFTMPSDPLPMPKASPENIPVQETTSSGPHASPLPSIIQKPITNVPPNFQELVKKLQDIGYEKTECEAALHAACYDLDLAANYLLSGNIPDIVQPKTYEENNETDDSEYSDDNSEDMDDDMITTPSDSIAIRNIIVANPQTYMNIIRQTDPVLYQQVADNPELFLQRLGLSINDYPPQRPNASEYENLMSEFSNEEKEAIHRLESKGYDTMTIIQVFVACDKNEQLTAQCLSTMQ